MKRFAATFVDREETDFGLWTSTIEISAENRDAAIVLATRCLEARLKCSNWPTMVRCEELPCQDGAQPDGLQVPTGLSASWDFVRDRVGR